MTPICRKMAGFFDNIGFEITKLEEDSMVRGFIQFLLLIALSLLTLGAWLSELAFADAMFIFAAFSIGGIWSKYSAAGLSRDALISSNEPPTQQLIAA